MSRTGRTALLALDGELPSAGLIARLGGESHIVVAADGAALRLLERDIVPDVVIGDLDTLGLDRNKFSAPRSIVIERPDQDRNDFEKALLWLLDEGYDTVTVIGHAGGMVDHTLNNFSIVARFASRIELLLRDDRSTGYAIRGHIELATRPGERISLIPLPTARLKTEGLRWELDRETLGIGEREGASNLATGEHVAMTTLEGCVLLVHYPSSGV